MKIATTFGTLISAALSASAMAQTLDLPSPREAARAYVKATNSMGMSWGEKKEGDYIVTLGECAKSTSGPGLICMASIKGNVANAKPFHNKLGFTKGPSGEWIATFER
ncbi:hypothetical protein [Agrobacterium fabrum]|uniref:hypothetical protein n=1 Tax=Agrobacterium fabrum TaxID=1176649 RepID=UPI001E3987A7|nr:hypothetical protein [Agrobacterium fabrum]WLP57459.1 hypothetical protein Q8X45_23355 [Agrobacterium fabrum]